MRQTIFLLSLVLALSLGQRASAQVSSLFERGMTDGTTLPPSGAATIDNPSSPEINPAGIGFLTSPEIYYIHERSLKLDRLVDSLFAGTKLIGPAALNLGIQWVRPSGSLPNYRKTTWTAALGCSAVSAGISYNLFSSADSELDHLTSFDLGLTLRPSKFWALAIAARDINAPKLHDEKLARRYDFGLGARPFSDRVMLSADLLVNDKSGFQTGVLSFAAAVEPLDGISIQGGLATKLHGGLAGQIAIALNFPHFGATWAAGGTSSSDWDQLLQVRLSAERYRSISISRGNWVVVDLEESLAEKRSRLASLFSSGEEPYFELLSLLARIRQDKNTDGVLIKVNELSGLGQAKIEELRNQLVALKENGKRVIALFYAGGDNEYYLASAADRIFAVPQATLLINGFSTSVTFFAQMLQKVGVTVDVTRVGAYKTAPDSFTRSDMSPEARQMLDKYLDEVFERFVKTVASSRKISREKLIVAINKGIFTAQAAQTEGLFDAVIYPDELPSIIEKSEGRSISFDTDLSEPSRPQEWGAPPKIAIIKIEGTIADGKNRSDPLGLSKIAGAQTIVAQLQQAVLDWRTAAIVLRIDSGGGSGTASDLIWRAVRKVREQKPVIVSMGDLAASGGYYIAMAGNEIFAEPSTLTGSIGVFALKPNFGPLLAKLGINQATLKRGERADLFSLARPWNPGELEAMQKYVEDFYDQFITKVSESRKLDKPKVDSIGRGRIWSGEAAKQIGLVDQLGGIEEAIASARKKANLENSEVEMELMRENDGLLGLSSSSENSGKNVITKLIGELASPIGLAMTELPEGPMAMLPYELKIK